ncbi:MAG: ABC transporter permease [Turicibacter sp.]|nr:ABC transporter permease [Turicibacter sp.]
MSFFESVGSAAYSVFANRMRSVLTMLGIIIGISAVIMITSIGAGFANSMNDIFAGFGIATLQVNMRNNMNEPATRSDMLTLDSAEFLKSHPDVLTVTPLNFASARAQLRLPTDTTSVSIQGTTETLAEVQTIDVVFGRFLAEMDVERATPVAVIDSRLARDAFGRANVVGETLRTTFGFGTVDLQIIGVYRVDEFTAQMSWGPTTIYVPITYLNRITNNLDGVVNTLMVAATDTDQINQTAAEVSRLLSLKHGNEDRYNVTSMMSQIDEFNEILGAVTGFVALVAFISLVVGGIGVMNIMLVTVTERTKEIGIRKSLGATDGNIQFQFLIEAMILTATGGAIGIVLGYYGAYAMSGLLPIDIVPSIDAWTVAGTVAASSLIGIIFGVYPARKAAKLDPIEALRYE